MGKLNSRGNNNNNRKGVGELLAIRAGKGKWKE